MFGGGYACIYGADTPISLTNEKALKCKNKSKTNMICQATIMACATPPYI